MANTTASEVFDSFESSFKDKVVIPESLEFDEKTLTFSSKLDQYTIDTIAAFMKQMYQEREVSRVNKMVSIVSKDISIDGGGHTKTAAKSELDYTIHQSNQMVHNQKPTAYE